MESILDFYKNSYVAIKKYLIKERNVTAFFRWLEADTDFLRAPASTRFHLATRNGLLIHSINVYYNLRKLAEDNNLEYSLDTIMLCGVFHDLCKVNTYKEGFRWQKDDNQQWQKVPTFEVDDVFPMGHGDKSVFLLMQHGISLSDEEAIAIRQHMGPWDTTQQQMRQVGDTFHKYPLAFWLHIADMVSNFVTENEQTNLKENIKAFEKYLEG